MKLILVALTAALLLCLDVCGQATGSTFRFRFADGITGIRVIPDSVTIRPRTAASTPITLTTAQIKSNGRTSLNVADGTYDITVFAAGYKPMTAWFEMRAHELDVNFSLDAVQSKPELTPDYIQSLTRPGAMLITGIVTDEESGMPLPGATIRTADSTGITTTGSDGYFALSIPLGCTEQQLAVRGRLIFTATDHTTEVREQFDVWPGGDIILRIHMQKGTGERLKNIVQNREVHLETYKP